MPPGRRMYTTPSSEKIYVSWFHTFVGRLSKLMDVESKRDDIHQ
jgi:hypothetical protein